MSRSKQAVDVAEPIEIIAVAPPPKPAKRPMAIPKDDTDVDFGAGILDLDTEERSFREPPRPTPIREADRQIIPREPMRPGSARGPQRPETKPAERAFQAVEDVDDEHEADSFGKPVDATERDDPDGEAFFAPAPDEIEDAALSGEQRSRAEEFEDSVVDKPGQGAIEQTKQPPPEVDSRQGRGRGRRPVRGEEQGRRPVAPVRPPSRQALPRDDFEDQEYDVHGGPSGTRFGPADARDSRRPAPRSRTRPAADDYESDDAPAEECEMLINLSDEDECRIAIMRDNRLDELYIERTSSASNVGNIYKGRVTNVEPSIQAAFIDFGLPAHGFLHISDLHPQYFPESRGENELVGRKTPRRHRPPIQTCLKRGHEVIVQVIKEGIGTKGPTLSTYISIPGRFLVMMPGMEQLGVSRKIEDEQLRRQLREMLGQLTLPRDMGFIVRTAGIDRSHKDLQRDLNYLTRLWGQVALKIKSEPAPAELYKESDLVIRTIRDVFDSSVRRILVDNPEVSARVKEFLAIASPGSPDVVQLYDGHEPMFHRFGIETEIDKLYSKQVPLPCGGSLVIEQTEALVAIDVNSGRFRVPENAEETAYRVNHEAADEIARQLRLRDLGGLIICDFIDMLAEKHRRAIEWRLAEALKKHKERAKLLRISRFGILEMTRQRQRPSFAKSMFAECPRCGGSGRVKATESMSLDVMRQIALASHREGVASIDVKVAIAVANEIQNRKRHQIAELEKRSGQTIRVHGDGAFTIDHVQITATDRRGREVPGLALSSSAPAPSTRSPIVQRSPVVRPAVGRPPQPARPMDRQAERPVAGPPIGTGEQPAGGERRGGRRRGRRGGRGRGGNRNRTAE